MPKVNQAHLDARRQQIVDAARARFTEHGFAGTSMADVVAEAGLSTGAIYRYFSSKDDLVIAVCEQGSSAFPNDLTDDAIHDFLEHVRQLAKEKGHARLTAQIYAEAALSPALAEVVRDQLAGLRSKVIELLPEVPNAQATDAAEAFVAICVGYSQQLAVRGDVDPAPFAAALARTVSAGRT
ncbi:TetR/AcrR family transcriptional regulator [Aeromicrobium chenweiae]|uniref:TetR/AcrR family transcriptional regulator n=1 Tax=Aeromicrobium chenweiae TaxID=2079793 RepID=A0A2S0WLE5_9ACTN|nr:TetR/AcrR family transcriptional regulator [Aeromicrobium chenweiae]AWB92112.1 TetR/AcrR family transcriptional regulator [Aeromicrobium chenweiae]TGN32961.1 TetR/AcrR family transcriptional regulator [Aeromicrobium chenweiae]